jgi:hypothetical protein
MVASASAESASIVGKHRALSTNNIRDGRTRSPNLLSKVGAWRFTHWSNNGPRLIQSKAESLERWFFGEGERHQFPWREKFHAGLQLIIFEIAEVWEMRCWDGRTLMMLRGVHVCFVSERVTFQATQLRGCSENWVRSIHLPQSLFSPFDAGRSGEFQRHSQGRMNPHGIVLVHDHLNKLCAALSIRGTFNVSPGMLHLTVLFEAMEYGLHGITLCSRRRLVRASSVNSPPLWLPVIK